VPQIVSYHLSPVSRVLARALVKLRHFGLPNILLGEQVVPEFLEPTDVQLLDAASRVLGNPDAIAEARRAAERLDVMLGPPGAVARLALEVIHAADRRPRC